MLRIILRIFTFENVLFVPLIELYNIIFIKGNDKIPNVFM